MPWRCPAIVLLAFGSCVPGGSAAQRPAASPSAPPASAMAARADAHLDDASPEPEVEVHIEHLERAAGTVCPIAFDDADIVLAHVGDATITACDLVLERERERHEGLTVRDPRELLRTLVADALLAQESRSRGLDTAPDVSHRIDETLGAVLVRNEALGDVQHDLPDDAAVQHYYDTHRDEFSTPEEVHLREIVVGTEAQARAIIAEAAQTPFDQLVSRTIVDGGRRDEGDLGWVPASGNDRVAAAVAQAGFALADPGTIAPNPVRADVTILVGRHHRPRTEMRWHVVQLLDRRPAGTVPLADAAPIIRHRLSYARFDAARRAAHDHLLEQTRHAVAPEIGTAALRHVRVRQEPRAPDRRSHR